MRTRTVQRVSVIVPVEHAQRLLDGVRAAGVALLGDYTDWAWMSGVGEEQFRPLPGARPARGNVGELERVPSVRVEWCIARDAARLHALVAAIRAHHPWQVPAIFIDESTMPLP